MTYTYTYIVNEYLETTTRILLSDARGTRLTELSMNIHDVWQITWMKYMM